MTYAQTLSKMTTAYEQLSGGKAEDVSDAGVRLKVLAGEIYRLSTHLAWLEREAFVQTATGEWLDRHGEQFGLERKPAAHAEGTLTFSRYLPLSFDVTIPEGTVCAVPGEDPIEFETTEDVTLSEGELSVDAPARAVVSGRSGNAAAGSINTMPVPPSGMNYVTNKAAFTGGKDAETDTAYRARLLALYKEHSSGANTAYYKNTALEVEGVGAATAVAQINGAGTVGVYVWGENAAPTASILKAVRERFEDRRELGVQVSVQAAQAKKMTVGVRVKLDNGADFAAATESIKTAVGEFFAKLSIGSEVYLTQLERAVLNAAPVIEMEFFSSTRAHTADPAVIPTLGEVTVEELE